MDDKSGIGYFGDWVWVLDMGYAKPRFLTNNGHKKSGIPCSATKRQCGKHHRAPQCAQPRHPGAAPAVPPHWVPRVTPLYPPHRAHTFHSIPAGGRLESSNVPHLFLFLSAPFSVLARRGDGRCCFMMQFLWLSFSGLGEIVPNHHKFSNPVPGWRFVVIWHVFLIVRVLLQFSQIEFPAARCRPR